MLSGLFFLSHTLHSHTRWHSCRDPHSRKGHVTKALWVQLFPSDQSFYFGSPHFQNANYCHVSAPCDDVIFPLSNPFLLNSPGGRSSGRTSTTSSPATLPCSPELWSVTMVFVSFLSNAIITLNSYSVKKNHGTPHQTSLFFGKTLPFCTCPP